MCNRTLPTCVLGVETRNPSIHLTTFSRGHSPLRDWSLITGRGRGGTKREWGACEVLPLRIVGSEKVLAMLKGGGAQNVLG